MTHGRVVAAKAGQRSIQQWRAVLRDDWHGSRRLAGGAALLLVTSLVVIAYYLNHPQVELYPDSNGYMAVTARILTHGTIVDALRLPGYPLLLALVATLARTREIGFASVVQGALFVLATVEVYALTLLALRRTWIALTVGALMGTNLYLLKYVKPIISDGLALWLVVSLALAVAILLQARRPRDLWIAAAFLLALFLTRPEWIYAPIPIFGYLLAVAHRHGQMRRLLPHVLAVVAVLYLALGVYVYQNSRQNGYAGITWVQNVNLLGKVMQYHMQNEAPPEYAGVVRVVDAYLKQGKVGPWALVESYPPLKAHYASLAGAYASAVVAHHPVEFMGDSLLVLFSSSGFSYTRDGFESISAIQPHGPFAAFLGLLRAVSAAIYQTYVLFPVVALFWLVPALWQRAAPTAFAREVELMGAVALLGLYALIVTTLGGYGDYARIHSSFDPLLIVVIWGSLLAIASRLVTSLRRA
jgi:hypothetical protein